MQQYILHPKCTQSQLISQLDSVKIRAFHVVNNKCWISFFCVCANSRKYLCFKGKPSTCLTFVFDGTILFILKLIISTLWHFQISNCRSSAQNEEYCFQKLVAKHNSYFMDQRIFLKIKTFHSEILQISLLLCPSGEEKSWFGLSILVSSGWSFLGEKEHGRLKYQHKFLQT